MNDLPVFIVTNGSDKIYKIWADGQVEGFDMSPQIVINRIPQLVDKAVNDTYVKLGFFQNGGN